MTACATATSPRVGPTCPAAAIPTPRTAPDHATAAGRVERTSADPAASRRPLFPRLSIGNTLNTVKEIGAYLGLLALVACVLSAGVVASQLTAGVLGLAVGAVAAFLTFRALRGVTGRVVGAAVDEL